MKENVEDIEKSEDDNLSPDVNVAKKDKQQGDADEDDGTGGLEEEQVEEKQQVAKQEKK